MVLSPNPLRTARALQMRTMLLYSRAVMFDGLRDRARSDAVRENDGL